MGIVSTVAVAVVVSASGVLVPFVGPVVRPFDPPQCHYCAGHRGISVSTGHGQSVHSVAAGTVTFAGQVGGDLFVVVEISPEVKVTYGYVAEIAEGITASVHVEAGQVLATTGVASYLGVRVADTYVDPLRFFHWGSAHLVGPGHVDTKGSTR